MSVRETAPGPDKEEVVETKQQLYQCRCTNQVVVVNRTFGPRTPADRDAGRYRELVFEQCMHAGNCPKAGQCPL
ncbi:hypothetical protein ACFQ3P_01900 [Paraburkholderia sabiae]|jgi:hypothetical protein|uniref:hypothetical protein n=1 Tax=Paraburkholderia sabiae TaxID=273251 RepID=UPI0019193538|nr:hypothetical protein [Paraburkholderia sabiae]CAD6510657.1 hypothetical protein LMG24235_00379 [Paraburkholderia sabiae]CAG9206923.1 hypothetical protein PSAB6_250230 [Paraburkholderia sabiae]